MLAKAIKLLNYLNKMHFVCGNICNYEKKP